MGLSRVAVTLRSHGGGGRTRTCSFSTINDNHRLTAQLGENLAMKCGASAFPPHPHGAWGGSRSHDLRHFKPALLPTELPKHLFSCTFTTRGHFARHHASCPSLPNHSPTLLHHRQSSIDEQSKLTHHASRITHHASRFTFHVSRLTFHVSPVVRRPSSTTATRSGLEPLLSALTGRRLNPSTNGPLHDFLYLTSSNRESIRGFEPLTSRMATWRSDHLS